MQAPWRVGWMTTVCTAGCAPTPVAPLPAPIEAAYEAAVYGPTRLRMAAPDDAELVVLYGGEIEGSFEGCGCEGGVRGGVPRTAAYAARVRATGVPVVLVDAGAWLRDDADGNGQLTTEVARANGWMVAGLTAGGWDALNVGWRDLRFLAGGTFPPAAVSTNLESAGRTLPPRWRVFEQGGVSVGVLGVSAPGRFGSVPEGYGWTDPIVALQQAVPEVARQVDVVVVLAYDLGARAREAAAIPGIDVLVDASAWTETWAPMMAADTVWVRPLSQGARLGELRVRVDEGRIVGLLDRKVVLEPGMPKDPALAVMAAGFRNGRSPP